MSISTEPSAIASARPSSPSTAASTSGVSGTMVMTMPAARPTSAGEAATVTPSARSASAFAAVRLKAMTGKPAFARLRAIGAPMMPVPTTPIVCCSDINGPPCYFPPRCYAFAEPVAGSLA